MRHTITISAKSEVKNQRVHSKKLPNFQQDSIVKIEQGDKKIYGIFTPDLMTEKAEISLMYMNLNQIEESLATISKLVMPSKLKYVEIQLSQIDYELVNNNFSFLERSFLDQVNLVWPGAKIPLYYNEGNFITLIPKVKDLHLVDPYAAISFMKKEPQQNLGQKQASSILDEQEQFEEKRLVLGSMNEQNQVSFGYDNLIYLDRETFSYLQKFTKKQRINSYFYCTVQPLLQFVKNPTFDQFQQFKRLQAASKVPELKPILVQIGLKNQEVSFEGSQINEDKFQLQSFQGERLFYCSEIGRLSLGLPEKLLISEENFSYGQQFETISLEMFMNELSSNKYKIQLQVPSHIKPTKTDCQMLRAKFSALFIKEIKQKREMVFLQNYYPFIIENEVYGLMISKKPANKKDFQQLRSFLQIRDISIANRQNSQKYQQLQKVIDKNIHVTQELPNQKMNQWLPIIKKLASSNSTNLEQQHNFKFSTIFQLCYQKQVKECYEFLTQSIRDQYYSGRILISTYSSNGKTYLHTYLNSQPPVKSSSNTDITYRSWYIDCRTLIQTNNRINDIKEYLESFICLCPYRLVFFDNIDVFIPLIEEGDQMRQKEKIIAHVLGNILFDLLKNNRKIGIFTSKSQANIDPIVKFDKIIKLKNPNRQVRAQIVHSLKLDKQKSWTQEFIDKTQSFSLGSLAHYLLSQQIPTKKQSKRKNDFSKIVGLQQAKRVIRSVIQKPNRFGFIYDKVKIKVPRGILLYGATGNGKTALGSAVEDQFPMKYFSVKGSDILSKYIGGSEAAVRQIFEKALSVAPSIIFFDQFESIVPRRNSSGTGVTDRVVNQFLCYLDGVSSTTGVFIIAASSRPDLIDPALLRPGRIDSHIYLQYPTQKQRSQLLALFGNSIKLEIKQQEFIEATANYSYSDLIGLLKELRIKKSSLVIKEKENPSPDEFKYIQQELFQQTVKSYRIGTELSEQENQKQLYQRFKQGKGPQIKKQKFIQM